MEAASSVHPTGLDDDRETNSPMMQFLDRSDIRNGSRTRKPVFHAYPHHIQFVVGGIKDLGIIGIDNGITGQFRLMAGKDSRREIKQRKDKVILPCRDERDDIFLRLFRALQVTDSQYPVVWKTGSIPTIQAGAAKDAHFTAQFFKTTQERKALFAIPFQQEDMAPFSDLILQRFFHSVSSRKCLSRSGADGRRGRHTISVPSIPSYCGAS